MRHGTSSSARALLAVGLAVVLAPFAATASHASARAGEVKVEGTTDNKFNPADATATADASGKVTIAFTSHGAHTYQSDEVKGLDSGPVSDGQTKDITFTAKPGKYAVYCLYHKTSGMVGTLTVAAAGGKETATPAASASAAPSSQPPASASASASAGAPDDNAPTAGASDDAGETETEGNVPGVTGNKSLEKIAAERAAQKGAVSGFKFFTMVCIAFLVILGVAVLFSTRPRRSGR
jgi:plastocyanin